MSRDPHQVIPDLPSQETVSGLGYEEIMIPEELSDPKSRERTIANLRLLWTRRKMVCKVLIFGLVASFLIAFLIPSRYESTTELMPPDQQSGNLGMLTALMGKEVGGIGGLSSLAGGVLGAKTSGDLFVGVLESRTIQDDVISKFNLRKVYGVRSWEDARKKLTSHTDIASDRKSGIISIKVTDHSPQRAAAMAQEFVEELNHVVTDLNTSSAHRERVFLEGRLTEVKQDLESAEKDFSEFASKNTAINIPEQGKAMIAAAAELEGQLIAAETQLQSVRQVYTDNNVRVRETQARADELRRQLGKMGGAADGTASMNNSGDAQSMYPSIRQLPVLGVNYADLYRRTKIEEAVFENLTQEYELARVQEVKETPSVKVLDPANIPGERSFPPRMLIGLGGMLLAGALGVMWVLGNEKWRRIDSQDSGKIFALEVAETVRTRVPWRFWNGSSGTAPGIGVSDQLTIGRARDGGVVKRQVEDKEK